MDEDRILACCNFLTFLLRSDFRLQMDHYGIYKITINVAKNLSLLTKIFFVISDRIDSNFVYALLQISEGCMKMELSNELRDAAVAVMLAYNTHFGPEDKYCNRVTAAISGREEADYLKQRMLHLLLNRGKLNFINFAPVAQFN